MSDIINISVTEGITQTALNAEATARSAADTTLQNNINTEITNRQTADIALDFRISELESNSGTVVVTTGTINVTVNGDVDYIAITPTGNITFNLTGSHVNGKIKRYFVNGAGASRTVTVTGSNLKGGIYNDTSGKTNEIIFECTATGVLYYWINTYNTPVITNLAPVASSVTISGTTTQGQTLTGSHTYFDNESDPAGTPQRQWYRADNTSGLNEIAISGATNSTYILVSADANKYLRYGVTPTATAGTTPGSIAYSAYTAQIAASNTVPVASNLGISGSASQGSTLTASWTYSDADSDAQGSSTVQWYRSDNNSGLNEATISGATNTTYILQAGDVSKYIRFRVIPVAVTGASPGTGVYSSYTAQIAATDTTAPTLSTIATASSTTILATISETTTGTVSGWSFKKNGSAITPTGITGSGSTTRTFTFATTFISTDVLLASYTQSTGDTVDGASTPNELVAFTDTSVTNNVANLAPTASPTISGTAITTKVLTANAGYADTENDAAGSHIYQWYKSDNTSGLNEVAITGATNSTYTIAAADNGKYIRVRVTPVAVTGTTPGSPVYSAYTAQVVEAEYIVWTNFFNTSQTGNDLISSGVADYDNYAQATKQLAGDGFIDYQFTTYKESLIGFNVDSVNGNHTVLETYIQLDVNAVIYYKPYGGASTSSGVTAPANAILRIERLNSSTTPQFAYKYSTDLGVTWTTITTVAGVAGNLWVHGVMRNNANRIVNARIK